MNNLLVDEKGKIRSFNEFKRKVEVVHKKYNQNYLQAEYQTAKRSAQAARDWKGYEENQDLFPNLKYMTVADDRVRHDHDKLHGIVKPVNDPFWNTHYPPNGWRCRCYVKPTTEAITTTKITTQPDKGFGLNVGKANQIFDSNEHPYFTFPAEDKKDVVKAFENFKLIAPYGKARYTAKNGAKVYVSPFADPADLFGNYRAAVKMANNNITVKIRPHVDLDSIKNPEFEIGKRFADRAEPKGLRGILSRIEEKTNKQGAKIVVLDFTYEFNKDVNRFEIAKKIRGAAKINKKLEGVVLLFNNEVISLKRDDIFKDVLWQKVIKKATKK